MNKQQRLLSLDVFRGLTIVGMIIVNSPGTSGQLSHAYWSGLTIADYVFPFFIFISGVGIALQSRRFPLSGPQRQDYYLKLVWRSAALFILGLAVNLVYTEFSAIRIAGVLQRIAIVYAVCSLLILHCSTRQLVGICGFILLSYWLLLLFVPAPGLEPGQLERGKNLVNWFDSRFLPGMLWRGDWDPEGLLSTYPAIVTGLLGVLAGKIIVSKKNLSSKISGLFSFGFVCLLLGFIWNLYFLYNKALWSSSFVLTTGGVACLFLAQLMWQIDFWQRRGCLYVIQVFGCNAIVAYVLHVILAKLLQPAHSLFTASLSQMGLTNELVSGLWICLFLALCWLPLHLMYRRNIFLKV